MFSSWMESKAPYFSYLHEAIFSQINILGLIFQLCENTEDAKPILKMLKLGYFPQEPQNKEYIS